MPVTSRACAVTAGSDNPTQYESSKRQPMIRPSWAIVGSHRRPLCHERISAGSLFERIGPV